MPWNTRSRTDPSSHPVSRILITGSTDGLGRTAAGALMDDGHDVVPHARTRERAAARGRSGAGIMVEWTVMVLVTWNAA
jgi:short-subunit dehydrogenase